ncbi:MAG TPA: pyruvate dehydrogenase complex dihydrolipoamide acetyltransferase [Stellaceae bacterium]|nr:pyruvate dehydrogenase complex dihydrolipoamide acetyltransferase [Stellaceae bacterium]
MPIQILMPALSPTMTEGNLAKWHKKEGDKVKAGDIIAEIETDKATMEFEAVDEGTLGRILVPEGTTGVKVNQPIAVILEEGESAGDIKAPPPASAAKPATPEAPKPAAAPAQAQPAAAKAPASAAQAPAPKAAAPAPLQKPQANGSDSHGAGRAFVSPLARRLAEKSGIALSQLHGSGPHGRIVKADVEAAQSGGGTRRAALAGAPSYTKAAVVALAGNIPYTEVPLTPMRRVIAKRMTESKQNVPHFYLTIDCEIDALLHARKDINETMGQKLSVNDFVIRATALALKQVPAANASYTDDAILRWNSIDIAVAVALDDGLITPIIKQADTKRVSEISAEMRDLGIRARAGKLALAEFQGGTFSISNLGMYGIRHFEAVINPPQGCILAVGVGEQRAVVKDGQLAIATVMSCTIACDHRVVDGAGGAQWMQAFKKLIEAPAALLV